MLEIPVVDLFAGPGGLGEGFSSVLDENDERIFKIKLSIEKDEYAHQTLELRSFFRQFKSNQLPDEYYSFIKETEINKKKELKKLLFKKYSKEAVIAQQSAWKFTLAEEENADLNIEEVDNRIIENIKGCDHWVLLGGPPCQAYSVIGRSRVKGIDEKDGRVYLYKEYLRIIAKHKPSIFIMENVKGLLSAKVGSENIFSNILNDLKNPNSVFPDSNSYKYRIFSLVKPPMSQDDFGFPLYKKLSDYLIHCENYLIPQKRHRVILLGIREDLGNISPEILKPSENLVKLNEVIGDLPKIRSGISRIKLDKKVNDKIYKKVEDNNENWKYYIDGYLKDILKYVDHKKLNGFVFENKEMEIPAFERGGEYIKYDLYRTPLKNKELNIWYKDFKLEGVCNHTSRMHLVSDLKRYLFASTFLKANHISPKLTDYPEDLLPDHKNAKSGKFKDRFKVQKADEPASTITSHASKDGHYFIHYDPLQCRSMTVRELARIQTFPDNYFFCGSRSAQYQQVGNAVPPLLARKIAFIVLDIIKQAYES